MSENKKNGHKRFNFSLKEEHSSLINSFTTLAANANRSLVLKASLKAFDALPDTEKTKLLEEEVRLMKLEEGGA